MAPIIDQKALEDFIEHADLGEAKRCEAALEAMAASVRLRVVSALPARHLFATRVPWDVSINDEELLPGTVSGSELLWPAVGIVGVVGEKDDLATRCQPGHGEDRITFNRAVLEEDLRTLARILSFLET
ncbi:MAG: hypothetical protein WAL25_04985 [Acidimicrobiia bacterium]